MGFDYCWWVELASIHLRRQRSLSPRTFPALWEQCATPISSDSLILREDDAKKATSEDCRIEAEIVILHHLSLQDTKRGKQKGGKGLNFVADLRYCEFSINALPIFSVKKLASLCSVMCGRPATSQERALQKLNPRGQIQTNGQPMSKYSKAFEQHLPVKHFGGLFWGKATPQCQYPQQRELLFQEFHTVTCFAAFALRNRKAECSSSLPIPPCRFLRPHFIDLYSKAIDHSIALQVELSGELPPLRSLPYGSLDHREFASSFNFTQLL